MRKYRAPIINNALALLVAMILLIFMNCDKREKPVLSEQTMIQFRAPRVLIITNGDRDGSGTISEGVAITLEALNKIGARVYLDNRSVLYRPEELTRYTHIYTPTLYGYNDADRNFSLTYLDTIALNNIAGWVAEGGILIAAENFGRNAIDGVDRITTHGVLTADNWILAKVFNCDFVESNLDGFYFEIDTSNAIAKGWGGDRSIVKIENPGWLLVPVTDSSTQKYETWARWNNHDVKRPAAILSHYQKGSAIYISLSLILHPINDGGLSTRQEIYDFWRRILGYHKDNRSMPVIGINPWPEKNLSALAITINSNGREKSLEPVVDSLINHGVHPTIFFHGPIEPDLITKFRKIPEIEIASGGFDLDIFSEASFETIREDILKSRQFYGDYVYGFRFPRLRRSPETLLLLHDHEFLYESSIILRGEGNRVGSLVPYNIPVFKQHESMYSTRLLELSPIEFDDWAFYGKGLEKGDYAVAEQIRDSELYGEYLNHTYKNIVAPLNGLMVTMSCPDYVGYSSYTLKPLLDFIDSANASGNIWIANLSEIARFWHLKNKIEFTVDWDKQVARCLFLDGTLATGQASLKITIPANAMLKEVSDKDGKRIDFIINQDSSYLVKILAPEILLQFEI
jgi:hypothetical protein